MPYGRGIALAGPAKSLLDILNLFSTKLNPSELLGAQQLLVLCVVLVRWAGSLIAQNLQHHDANPLREVLGWTAREV